jgi:hypothetical protein
MGKCDWLHSWSICDTTRTPETHRSGFLFPGRSDWAALPYSTTWRSINSVTQENRFLHQWPAHAQIDKKSFFERHPKCCFCGGSEEATTEDHVPGRGLFLGRLWPKGYVFPACFSCNNEASRRESLLAWLVRIRITKFSPDQEREFERYTLEVSRRFPDVWDGLKIHSRVESRRFLKEMGSPTTLPGVDGVKHQSQFPKAIIGQCQQRDQASLAEELRQCQDFKRRQSGAFRQLMSVQDGRHGTPCRYLAIS